MHGPERQVVSWSQVCWSALLSYHSSHSATWLCSKLNNGWSFSRKSITANIYRWINSTDKAREKKKKKIWTSLIFKSCAQVFFLRLIKCQSFILAYFKEVWKMSHPSQTCSVTDVGAWLQRSVKVRAPVWNTDL